MHMVSDLTLLVQQINPTISTVKLELPAVLETQGHVLDFNDFESVLDFASNVLDFLNLSFKKAQNTW